MHSNFYQIKRKTQNWYGECIGILILNAKYPCIPGNVGNASTFPFPVRYKVIKEATIDALLKKRSKSLANLFIQSALELKDEGVKAICGACGFMALFQRDVAEAVGMPVFLSSLIQIPLIYQTMSCKQKIGIITADSKNLTEEHFKAVGVSPDIPLIIYGMEDQKEFKEAILEEKGTLDSELIKMEVLGIVKKMMSEHPDVGSILLECSDLPPYAHHIQAIFDMPVFDFISLINYMQSVLVRKSFHGWM